jgi:S-sulfo-L-cysteine synthase (O-acetyl-L-serine-dependent)
MSTLLELVGNTPMVALDRLNRNPGVRLYGKLEGDNPGGSVKDRAARSMIEGALSRGDLRPGMQLVEATSGNTGIALAMIARLYDLPIELVMPRNSTRERVLTMQAFGATVTLLETIESCRDYAVEKAATGDYFMLDQFANPDNYLAHYRPPAPNSGATRPGRSPILWPRWEPPAPSWACRGI